MSRFLLHIFAAFAELEPEMIRERVTSGIRAAKANGQKLGRPRRVFRRDTAISMREAGMSWRKIAAEMGEPMATVIDACRAGHPSADSQRTDCCSSLSRRSIK
jgi:DNA invertase Pin-like site-specific DNA recombinase